MNVPGKATSLRLFDITTPPMRAFHMTWLAFFLCFFAWFGIAPLMKVVRDDLHLTKDQVGWCIIGSVAITILARLLVGWLCDQFGPRLVYTWLLVLGAVPVMGIGLAHNFETFLLFRVLIGIIGASFVVTQFHTSLMFAPNCVGTANAAAAGWGNLGGGVTQAVMPLVFTLCAVSLGLGAALGWRVAMFAAGFVCLLAGVAYWFLTQDCPTGNFHELRARGELPARQGGDNTFLLACRDYRVWILFVLYGCCFGMELTIDNIAAQYFADYFDLGLIEAGLAAFAFGMMNLFARALGGMVSDRAARRWGLAGRVRWLFLALLGEGVILIMFAQIPGTAALLIPALLTLMLFGLFVKMSNGATYAVVPFVNKRALGSVAGIVGAGGNAGAVAAGFLLKDASDWPTALLLLGLVISAASFLTLLVRLPAPVAETPPSFTTRTPVPEPLGLR
jgi:NNP family nitrate/nitrite transporter-like MFS transporter